MKKSAEATTAVSNQVPRPDLGDPLPAGVLAWLIPGAGHWYQGRRTKAVLFFVCILGSFSYGLWLGEGRVVYAAWGPTSEEKRLPYFCQLGAGVVALPALYQAKRFQNKDVVDAIERRAQQGRLGFWDWFMAPPRMTARGDELDELNYRLNRRFELGTVYTMIAGLLNLLVIFDACGGPALGWGRRSADESAPQEPEETAAPSVG